MDVRGKTCLVTGGTRGIGAAAALLLARQGAAVSIVGRRRDDEALATLAALEATGAPCMLVNADMGVPEDARRCVAETAERLGPVAVLIHSAGGLVPGGIMEVTPDTWYRAFEIHVHAVYHLARAVVPGMRERRGGVVVLVSSVAGLRGLKTNVAYQVVKGALPAFVRALAWELADDDVRVNAVAPGIVRTRFHDGMSAEQKRHNLENRIPLHREGRPEDIARLIGELIANDYMTGQTVVIDGGLTMRIA